MASKPLRPCVDKLHPEAGVAFRKFRKLLAKSYPYLVYFNICSRQTRGLYYSWNYVVEKLKKLHVSTA